MLTLCLDGREPQLSRVDKSEVQSIECTPNIICHTVAPSWSPFLFNQMGMLVCTLHSAQIPKGLGTVAAYLVQDNILHKYRLLLFQKKLCHFSIINYH